MRYMCLIADDEAAMANWSEDDYQAILADYAAFNRDAKQAGVYMSGEPLQPASTATTVRVRNDATMATDGPFAETKEQLGGYYILDCADLDEALAWAARIPGAKTGSVEVRPIMELELPE